MGTKRRPGYDYPTREVRGVVELIEAFLSVVLAGLSVLLASVALLANRYFPDRRFLFVGIGLLGMGAVGVLSLISLFSPTLGDSFDVGEVPLAILVGAILLLNASLLRRTAVDGREAGG